MKYLYKFYENCGRMGSLDGIFVADEKDIEKMIGKNVYLGEVLGKHSDVDIDITDKSFTKQELDSETIEKVCKLLGETWSGYNPIAIYKENREIDGYEDDEGE